MYSHIWLISNYSSGTVGASQHALKLCSSAKIGFIKDCFWSMKQPALLQSPALLQIKI